MEKFFEAMEGPFGRLLRVVLGVALICVGFGPIAGRGARILVLASLLPIAMGLWGPCLVRLAARGLRCK